MIPLFVHDILTPLQYFLEWFPITVKKICLLNDHAVCIIHDNVREAGKLFAKFFNCIGLPFFRKGIQYALLQKQFAH
jgi:hypothetical protein